MDLVWNDKRTGQFVTNVGLITSNGRYGPNVMAAEWTCQISFSPALIVIHISDDDATAENIMESKEFGVNIAAENQNIISSITGKYTGKEIDKIAILKDLGIEFYPAKKINVPMIKGAAMNAECKLIKQEKIGDHIMFTGKIIELSADENIKPLIYHQSKYWKFGNKIIKPSKDVLDKIKQLVEKHSKK